MILLASDTSTKSLSVAVCKDGTLIRGITEQTGMTHCQTYMPAVLRLLEESGLCFSDIDLVCLHGRPGIVYRDPDRCFHNEDHGLCSPKGHYRRFDTGNTRYFPDWTVKHWYVPA